MIPTSNPFKEAIKAGKPQIGFWLMLASPYATEVCASCGFDWVLIDGEHSPNDIPLMAASLQSVAGYGPQAVARVPIGDSTLIKQYLDIGAQTILVPMVDTAEQAADMVRAMRYPPHGIRGVGAGSGNPLNRSTGNRGALNGNALNRDASCGRGRRSGAGARLSAEGLLRASVAGGRGDL